MEYFILEQDERYTNIPVLQHVRQKIDVRHMNRLRAHHLADTTIFQVKASVDSDYLDLLSTQLFLVTERLKSLMEMYEPESMFKLIPLMDIQNAKQTLYYLPIFDEIDALSPNSEFNLDHSVIKKLVLQRDRIGSRRIFRVKESEKPLIIIRLDVAESILRRDLVGIRLKRVLVE
ncbi:hypothetical protein D1872_205790 [compost metagenome]